MNRHQLEEDANVEEAMAEKDELVEHGRRWDWSLASSRAQKAVIFGQTNIDLATPLGSTTRYGVFPPNVASQTSYWPPVSLKTHRNCHPQLWTITSSRRTLGQQPTSEARDEIEDDRWCLRWDRRQHRRLASSSSFFSLEREKRNRFFLFLS